MRFICGMFLLTLLASPLLGQAVTAPPSKPSKDDVARWIKQLASDDFNEREEATRKLWEAGSVAEDAVNQAAKSADAEVSRRATEIADKFRWGIYPDTPKAVADAISRFQNGDQNSRAEVLKELLNQGTPGCRAVIRIARRELGAEVRPVLLNALNAELGRSIPDLLATRNHELLQELLDIALDDTSNPDALHNYTAYWLLAGKLDDRIAHHKKLIEQGNTERRRTELLALLYRARGSFKEAIALLEKDGNDDLVVDLLQEAGDWKALVARGANVRQGIPLESLAFRTTYARLAGDAKVFDSLIDELKKRANDFNAEDGGRFDLAKALFLNDQPDAAMALLEKGPHTLDRMQILLGRLRHKEAFALAQKARDEKLPDLPAIELLEARTLYALGEKEAALKIFDRYAAQLKPGLDVSWLENLVESEAKSGLRDRALEHTAKILANSPDQGWPGRLFSKVFPGKGELAEAFYPYMKERFRGQDGTVLLRQMRDLLDGKVKGEALLAIAKNATDTVSQLPPVERNRALQALAEVLANAEQEKAALDLLEPIKLDKARLLMGDILHRQGKFDVAARTYREAFDLDRANPLALYLEGLALEKAGKAETGKALVEQSHWLSLGREEARNEFLRELAKRGHTKALLREADLLRRTSRPGDYYAGEAIRRQAMAALERKDYAASATAHEQAMLRCLLSHINFVEKAAYVGVPAMIHSQRAAGLAQAGKFDDAKKEFELAVILAPGVIEGSIRLVQVLEKAGRKEEADATFDRTQAAYRAMLKEYPQCAWAHNSSAWLAATTRRGLEQARRDAEKAISLEPETAGYHDTLAEVLFQLGEKEKAIDAQKKAIALSPKRLYFKKQLARLEAGDRNADLPLEDDEDDDE